MQYPKISTAINNGIQKYMLIIQNLKETKYFFFIPKGRILQNSLN